MLKAGYHLEAHSEQQCAYPCINNLPCCCLYAILPLDGMSGRAVSVRYDDVCAGRSAQSAARTLDAAGAQMADATAARMDKIGQELLRDLQEGLQNSASAPLKQLSKLNAKLEVCPFLCAECTAPPLLMLHHVLFRYEC